MTTPISRIIEGLRVLGRVTPQSLVRAKVVAREQEARFILEMAADARDVLSRNEDILEGK